MYTISKINNNVCHSLLNKLTSDPGSTSLRYNHNTIALFFSYSRSVPRQPVRLSAMYFHTDQIFRGTDLFQLPTNAHFLYSITIYMLHYNPRHVSSITMLIFRRSDCIITASGIVTLCIVRRLGAYYTAVYRE